MRNICPLRKNL